MEAIRCNVRVPLKFLGLPKDDLCRPGTLLQWNIVLQPEKVLPVELLRVLSQAREGLEMILELLWPSPFDVLDPPVRKGDAAALAVPIRGEGAQFCASPMYAVEGTNINPAVMLCSCSSMKPNIWLAGGTMKADNLVLMSGSLLGF
jgi:hypothetical protein